MILKAIARAIEQHWYQPRRWLIILLLPLTVLFAVLSSLRRMAYRWQWCASYALPVPVVVLGNINVGGVGKTPLTLALIQAFQRRGVKVGVISRGYGGTHQQATLVEAHSPAALVGDEPLLLAASGAPVVVGQDKVAAGRHLLTLFPDVDLILSDDGLQHYRLRRDLEIIVLDGKRGLGNGYLLPAGPLREPAGRLEEVDAIVVNGSPDYLRFPSKPCPFSMQLQAGAVYNLDHPSQTMTPELCSAGPVIAMAGIAQPERFFHTLQTLGWPVTQELVWPDHHAYQASDVPEAAMVIVTAKDAVKLQQVLSDDKQRARLWVLPVQAQLKPDLDLWILTQLKIPYGR